MTKNTAASCTDTERRRLLGAMVAGGAVVSGCTGTTLPLRANAADDMHNSLLWAVAWKQSAAEYFALCHQAYNLARLRVADALRGRSNGIKPLAVITDMDDTIMHARSYWGYLIKEGREFFDDPIWDAWLPDNDVTAAPGAKAFFDFCRDNDVEVFYVTNRDQGEKTYSYAMRQLVHLDMPYADDDHLYVFRETSDKTPARDEIMATFDVAVTLGDNLNDYKRDYYVKDVDERMRLMERDSKEFGRDFVLLPNPTDGHWVRAILGDSEPPPSDANRRLLFEAATKIAWKS